MVVFLAVEYFDRDDFKAMFGQLKRKRPSRIHFNIGQIPRFAYLKHKLLENSNNQPSLQMSNVRQ